MRVTDPVCGVQTDTDKAVAQEDYGGRTYFFCSAECHRLFKASPERYVTGLEQTGRDSADESDW